MKKRRNIIISPLLAGILLFSATAFSSNNSNQSNLAPPSVESTASRADRAVKVKMLDIVKVESGLLSGVTGKDPSVKIFKGIPYAAPPVGDLRWKAPQPPAKWDGVRRADAFGNWSIQTEFDPNFFFTQEFNYTTHEPFSEDSLYLNVYTTAKSADEKQPVLFWIHGGAMLSGSGAEKEFDAEKLAKKGIIVVTINYRLGIFGFFAHPELTKESGGNSSGNYGLLDQIAALKWVKNNITAFGGDPDKVTIDGQSAGGGSVINLLASPLAKGLYRGAIIQSAAPRTTPMMLLKDKEQVGIKLAEKWGAKSINGLRALPVEKFYPKGLNGLQLMGAGYSPNIDGYVLTENPAKTLLEKGVDVSLMIGSTSGEGAVSAVLAPVKAENFIKSAKAKYGAAADEFLKFYPAGSDEEANRSNAALSSDESFATLRLVAAVNSNLGRVKVYQYYFDRNLPGKDSEIYGAFHSSELWYVFNSLVNSKRPWEDADYKLAEAMSSYWANFVKNGDPNGQGLANWPAYDSKTDMQMELGTVIGARTIADKDRITFITKYLTKAFNIK